MLPLKCDPFLKHLHLSKQGNTVGGMSGRRAMGHWRSRHMKIAIVDDLPHRAERIKAALASDTRFATGAIWYPTLSDAYVGIELAEPEFVIVSATFSALAEFAMFKALLNMLRVPHIVIGATERSRAETKARWADDSHVASFLDRLDAHLNGARPQPKPHMPTPDTPMRPVLIGSSTGGVEALETILRNFGPKCPPTLVVQHIKPHFLAAMVARLNKACPARIVEAEDHMTLKRGVVAVAPGGPRHLELVSRTRMALVDGAPVSGHRPSVDRLFQSATRFAPAAVAVILTGMGRDGAVGMAQLRKAGAWTIAQDEATSVVYGMPHAAKQEGGVCKVLPLRRIGPSILEAASHAGAAQGAVRP